MKISSPSNPEEFEKYYRLRWEVLRKPWNQPIGSERDDTENSSLHLMSLDDEGNVTGVCRMHLNTPEEAQVRYMAVAPNQQGKGTGAALLQEAEKAAVAQGAHKMVLQARDTALGFYERCGYKVIQKTHLLYGSIQHYLMEKTL